MVFDKPKRTPLPKIWKLPLCYAKRIVKKCTGRGGCIFFEQHYTKERQYIAQHIQPFIDEHIHRKVIRSFRRLRAKDFDALVVGSDQVWRPFYFVRLWGGKPIEEAYLSFAKGWDVKRIAYAASFGTDDWEYDEEQTLNCRRLLQAFDAVSVRETNAVKLCEEQFGVKAQHVLDPTMLLSEEDYCKLFLKENTPQSKGTLLCYVLDETEEIRKLIGDKSSSDGLVPFMVNNPLEYDESKSLEQRVKGSVEAWLRGFYDAEYVITDSFHACVFSIIFKKQFVVVGNAARGLSRLESLLKLFGLKDRLVSPNINIHDLPQIDYTRVYEEYVRVKDKSLSYLSEALI